MKILHYNLYNDGNIGMCNAMMSIENALIIALLTNRDKIVFYSNEKLYNTNSNKTIFDLFDISFNHEIVYSNEIDKSIKEIPYEFSDICFYSKDEPSKEFLNNRTNTVDLSTYIDVNEIRTLNNMTLGWYSYLFYLKENRKYIIEYIRDSFKPKKRYLDLCNNYVYSIKKEYGSFESIHIRRGDYLNVPNTKNKEVDLVKLSESLLSEIDRSSLLLLHTDEEDDSYFNSLKLNFNSLWNIDLELNKYELDKSEKGLVSLLIASHSNNFIGTLYSSFTGFIQRYRMYNSFKEEFKYLYSQIDGVDLIDFKLKEESTGSNTWNRILLPDGYKGMSFWFREWPESYPVIDINQNINIIPSFLTDSECKYIISKSDESEYYKNENRNRTIINIFDDVIIKDIFIRACNKNNFNFNNVEPVLQIFKQFEGGETFSHVDSIHKDKQGNRIASVLFYLNEDFDGSYIDFPYAGIRIKPKKGMMISYPLLNEFKEQDKLWTHSASIITRGVKYMCYFSMKEYSF
jgi:GDP-fucose protein O-fucosyltransferase